MASQSHQQVGTDLYVYNPNKSSQEGWGPPGNGIDPTLPR